MVPWQAKVHDGPMARDDDKVHDGPMASFTMVPRQAKVHDGPMASFTMVPRQKGRGRALSKSSDSLADIAAVPCADGPPTLLMRGLHVHAQVAKAQQAAEEAARASATAANSSGSELQTARTEAEQARVEAQVGWGGVLLHIHVSACSCVCPSLWEHARQADTLEAGCT